MAKLIADDQVYTATIDTLLQHGYAGATTKRIAKQAGINEVTLFRKYGSKAKLVVAAVSHERMTTQSQEAIYTGDVAADLLRIVQERYDATPRRRQLFPLIMSEIVRYPELREILREPYQMIDKFGEMITRYQKEGQLREGEPILIVGALLGPVIINSMLRSADPERPVPQIDLKVHVERFLAGYGLGKTGQVEKDK